MEKLICAREPRGAPAKSVSESALTLSVNAETVSFVTDNYLVREFTLLVDPGPSFAHCTRCFLPFRFLIRSFWSRFSCYVFLFLCHPVLLVVVW